MSSITRKATTYRLLERAEEIMPHCKEGEIPAILSSEQQVGELGFANYVGPDDWKNATRWDGPYWKDLIVSAVRLDLLLGETPELPIERVYTKHDVVLAGEGNGPFLLRLYGSPDEARKRLQAFLDNIVSLFPTRRADGLVFRILELPNDGIVYGVVPSYASAKR